MLYIIMKDWDHSCPNFELNTQFLKSALRHTCKRSTKLKCTSNRRVWMWQAMGADIDAVLAREIALQSQAILYLN